MEFGQESMRAPNRAKAVAEEGVVSLQRGSSSLALWMLPRSGSPAPPPEGGGLLGPKAQPEVLVLRVGRRMMVAGERGDVFGGSQFDMVGRAFGLG